MKHRSYARFVLLLTGVAAALIGIGLWLAPRFGGARFLEAMLFGCGLSWMASVIGGLPQVFVAKTQDASGVLVLGSTAIRMGITLGGALLIALATDVARASFLLWVAVSYLVLLMVDVLFALQRQPVE